MLPSGARLRNGREIAETVRTGVRAGGALLVIHLAAEPSARSSRAQPRIALSVGKPVGGAVDRNRVTRRLRHCLRSHLPDLPSSSRLVVRALPGSATASSCELDRELGSLIARAVSKVRHRARNE